MANFGTIRKVLAILGIFGQLGYYLFSMFFYWPVLWYLEFGLLEYVGGLYSWCSKAKAADSWSCDDVKEENVKSWDQEWASYGAAKAFVALAHLVALIALVLFYIHICVKNKIVAIVSVVCAIVQWLFTLFAAAICSGTMGTIGEQDTDPAYGIILGWLSWIICFGSFALALGILICIIKDNGGGAQGGQNKPPEQEHE
ncbi:uncharacterized protein LOC142337306 [Convolutriloba macropyga]|uniref:uncharacterized protein LOC142337306 n=1 Tax=Convolutriloba macropyga TaxID=536237 RepID=UPI003F52419C